MSAMQFGDKIYASDCITGWAFYEKSHTILHKVIENRDVNSACNYAKHTDLIDKTTCLNITPLFMMLQYSIVADFSPAIKILVDKKLELKTNFNTFFENINLAKKHGNIYIQRLLDKLKSSIGEKKYKIIMKDINY